MSNLLEKASIITTPTAYSDGKLHSVKPVKTLGNELVVNGDFDTDSDWVKQNSSTISGGVGNIISNGGINGSFGNWSLYQDIMTLGKKYKVSFSARQTSGTGKFQIGQAYAIGFNQIITSSFADYYFYITASDYGGNTGFITVGGQTSGDTFEIDNVSVKEVIDADFDFQRGSAATRVNSQGLIENVQTLSGNLVQNGDFSEIGSELISNGDFSNDGNGWTKQNNSWSFSSGKAFYDNSQNGWITNSSSGNIVQGKFYKVTFEIGDGNAKIGLAAGSGAQLFKPNNSYINEYSVGNHELYLKAFTNSSNGFLLYGFSSGESFSIDNVSVKEVGQNWVLSGSGWSIGEDKIVSVNGSNWGVYQSNALVSGKTYKITYEVKDYVSGTFGIRANQVGGITATANGVYTDYLTSNGDAVYLLGYGTFNGSVTNISVIEITDDTDLPRIDYTDGCGSLLLEPQRTNLSSYSEDFSNAAWSKNNVSINTNNAVSPDGSLNASSIVGDGSTSYHWIQKDSGSGISGKTYTVSFFAKKGSLNFLQLVLDSSVFGIMHQNFDLENGVIGSSSGSATPFIKNYGNGWYRLGVTATATSSNTIKPLIALANSNTIGRFGSFGTSGNIKIYGVQVEEGSYPTSYIPTNGSSATRLADVCNNAGSSDLINSTEGVLYAEIAALADDGTSRYITLSDGTADNSVRIYLNSNGTQLSGQLRSGGGLQCLFNHTVSDLLEFNKIAFSYKQNDFSFWINGIEVDTDTSGNTPIGLSKLSFDRGDSTQSFYGKAKAVAVFPYLTNDELEGLTGEGYDTFNALALANNYTII